MPGTVGGEKKELQLVRQSRHCHPSDHYGRFGIGFRKRFNRKKARIVMKSEVQFHEDRIFTYIDVVMETFYVLFSTSLDEGMAYVADPPVTASA